MNFVTQAITRGKRKLALSPTSVCCCKQWGLTLKVDPPPKKTIDDCFGGGLNPDIFAVVVGLERSEEDSVADGDSIVDDCGGFGAV